MVSTSFSFGERKFGQTYAIRILLALILLGPVLLAWFVVDNPRQPGPILVSASVVMGVITVTLWILIGKTILTLSDAGIRRESVLGSQEILWTQIAETRYLVTPIRVSAHFGLIGMLIGAFAKTSNVNLTLRVIGTGGQQIKVTSNFQGAKEAIGAILGRILPGMVSEARASIERGGTVQFGPLTLSKTVISWKAGTSLPLTEVESAEIVASKLRVKRVGKLLAAFSTRSDKVPNVLVFLEVLESLVPRLKASAAVDPLARVRL